MLQQEVNDLKMAFFTRREKNGFPRYADLVDQGLWIVRSIKDTLRTLDVVSDTITIEKLFLFAFSKCSDTQGFERCDDVIAVVI